MVTNLNVSHRYLLNLIVATSIGFNLVVKQDSIFNSLWYSSYDLIKARFKQNIYTKIKIKQFILIFIKIRLESIGILKVGLQSGNSILSRLAQDQSQFGYSKLDYNLVTGS